ncbi:SusE domain-containing protein [Flavobacterium sp. ST-87]|uniref:SusE domain-containing protein n=1 Tax=Flavobacterium plantiphilum TaxID=3163297 RepID=A0ABW8XSV5_9FLAO
MRKYLFPICCALLLMSCGGGDDNSDPVTENKAPSIPGLVTPANNLLCIDNAVVFEWNAASDPDFDAITYQIEVAKDNQFKQIDYTNSASGTTKSISLEKGMRYYWRVKAVDSQNLSGKYSEVFQFYTEGVGLTNHLPFVPSLVKPELSSVLTTNSVILEWDASDVDANDVLTYDVYFGTTNPPTAKISSNQSLKTYTQSLNSSGTYYWSVDVKDQKGGISKGQVWRFVKN